MSDIDRSGEPDATRPDQEAGDLFERFSAAMRRDDVAEARSLAPGVDIETEGWPYEDETGPLNPDAFRAGDPRDHHVIATSDCRRAASSSARESRMSRSNVVTGDS